MATIAELFYLVEAGDGRWTIRHEITDEPAGSIRRTARGFALANAERTPLGEYESIPDALRSLYACC